MMPRCTSRCVTSTAVMPPNWRTIVSTLRIGSGLAAPGARSTPAMRFLRTAGSDRSLRVTVAGLGSDIEPELPLVAQDPLWSEDHQQHQRDTDDDEGELVGLLLAHEPVEVGVGEADDEDAAGEEDDRAEDRSPDRRRSSEQQGRVAEERQRAAHRVRLDGGREDEEHPAQGAEEAPD